MAAAPLLRAQFAPDEAQAPFDLLSATPIRLILVHQLLGFGPDFLGRLKTWLVGRHSIFYAHDFYTLCPRVTMIDAVEQFCGVAAVDVCTRCIALGGAHAASRLDDLTPAEHRETFAGLLGVFNHVVTPSESAASYLRQAFSGLTIEAVPHPVAPVDYPPQPRAGSDEEVVLFGAIGPHKGSAKLLEIAHLARLTHPHLRFRVIGHTDRDGDLLKLGNVIITGAYKPAQLPKLVQNARGRLALFLSGWPETYSYTLSEAVRLGFIPLVPDLGAPAERVRATGYGEVFAFPVVAGSVLELITRLTQYAHSDRAAAPSAFAPSSHSAERTRAIFASGSFAKQ